MHFGFMEGSLQRMALVVCFTALCCAAFAQGQRVNNPGAPAPAPAAAVRSPGPAQEDLDVTHKIQPGDKLSYRVDEDREEAKILSVADSGEIELPFSLGRIMAANKTCKALEQDIKTALEKDYYNRATVRVSVESRNTVRGKVFVSGEVTKPGPVTIPSDAPLTLREAIILAGPPTQWANLKKVKLVRGRGNQAETREINVDAIMKGRLENDVILQPGDFIVVPERGVVF